MVNSWVLLAEIGPVGILLLYLIYDRWQRHRRRERSPIQETLLRPAGYSLQREIERHQDRVSTWLMVTLLSSAGFGLLLRNLSGTGREIPLLTVLALAAAISVGVVIKSATDLRHYRLGLLGEQYMAEQLQHLVSQGYRIFHDVPGDGKWNIDHVAVGPGGVFAIESKCRRKKPSRNELKEHEAMLNGEVLRFPWCDDRKVVGQARGNARWLTQFLSNSTQERVSVFPIIALPGWFVLPNDDTDLKVLNGKQVAGQILSAPARLPNKLTGQIAFQLEQRCRDVEF